MTDSFEIANGDVRLRVEGLGRTLRALSKAGADAEDMRNLMHAIGNMVIKSANPPVGETGNLSASLRAGRGKTKAVVRAGGARAKYAGVVHYGWPARNIRPNPFLTQAIQASRNTALSMLDDGLADLLRNNDLL